MRVAMSLWTSCLGRDCLNFDLRHRRINGYRAGRRRFGRCSNIYKDECDNWASQRLFRPGRNRLPPSNASPIAEGTEIV